MHVAAIIAAGGRGVRLGADRPKQFLELGGRSILDLSIAALAASGRIHEIVVAVPADHLDAGSKACAPPIGAADQPFVAGGARRQDSVGNAFANTSPAPTSSSFTMRRGRSSRRVISRAIDGAAAPRRRHCRDCRARHRQAGGAPTRMGRVRSGHHSARLGLPGADAAGVSPRRAGARAGAKAQASMRPTKRCSSSGSACRCTLLKAIQGISK